MYQITVEGRYHKNIMADSVSSVLEECMEDLRVLGFEGVLKDEQREAVSQLLSGGDLLAVLPTGFGKSFIFHLFVKAKEKMTGQRCSAIVVSPLHSIVDDQIIEAESLGLTAISVDKAAPEALSSGSFQLIFASAEQALDKKFLKVLTVKLEVVDSTNVFP